ncbi:MAG: hypothetical protein M3R04_06760 [bacterium]|nr:hypothetical protein [bacterium]
MGSSWERKLADEQAEEREILRRQGEAESQRLAENLFLHGDILGHDDGRAGLGINPTGFWFGNWITMGGGAYFLLSVVVLVIALLIIIVGQTLKRTQYGQQAMQGTPPAASSANSYQPMSSSP